MIKLVTLVLAALILSGCGPEPGSTPVDFGAAPRRRDAVPASPTSTSPESAESPEGSRVVSVYYVEEAGSGFGLVKERHAVEQTPRIATRAMEQLIHGDPNEKGSFSPFPKAAQIIAVTISDRVATVDFSSEVLEANAGAEVESLGIQAAVWTLTEFPSISKVRFTVEGKDRGTASNGRVIEDWWGHVGLSRQPFGRDTRISPRVSR